jgi:hypothetical protein
MASEEELAKQIETYKNLGKQSPNVDVGMLMLNALQNAKQNNVSTKAKWWIYTISSSIPMSGFLFAFYYYFKEEDDAKQVAWIAIFLTVLSVLVFWGLGKLTLSGSGQSLQGIEQIKPSQIQQLDQ